MKRTTISAPDELLEQLRRLAGERQISLESLIEEALEEKVLYRQPRPRSLGIGDSEHNDTSERMSDERPVPRRPRPRSLGIGNSGYTDTSERASNPRDELFEPRSWR